MCEMMLVWNEVESGGRYKGIAEGAKLKVLPWNGSYPREAGSSPLLCFLSEVRSSPGLFVSAVYCWAPYIPDGKDETHGDMKRYQWQGEDQYTIGEQSKMPATAM